VNWYRKRSLGFRAISIVFALYLLALALFTFFPRPVLETGDPSAVAAFLQSHANFFYKVLYADTTSVAIGNYFMLTPFIVMAHLIFTKASLGRVFLLGVAVSAAIEISQFYIPGRVSDLVDFQSNFLSLLLGVAIIKTLERIERRRSKNTDF
jgi:hypothetical protein